MQSKISIEMSEMHNEYDSVGTAVLEIMSICERHQLKVAVAESLTTGNLQATLGSVSGASNFYEGGITAYLLDQKVKHLGVDKEHAFDVNCVSEQVANQMARGVAVLFETDIGIGTTGYAQPAIDKGIEVPMAYFSMFLKGRNSGDIFKGGKIVGTNEDRVTMQKFVAHQVIYNLLEFLKENFS